MKFYKPNELNHSPDEKIFKASPLWQFIPLLLVFMIPAALIARSLRNGIDFQNLSARDYIFSAILAITALAFSFIFIEHLRAALKKSNWLLQISPSAIIIKYRSHLNWRLPADSPQCVALDFTEIAWARKARERRITAKRNGKTTQLFTHIDFALKNPDTSTIEEHLQAERKLKCSLIHGDYPLQLLPDGILRLRCGGLIDYYRKSKNKPLQALSRHLTIQPDFQINADFTPDPKQQPADEDQKIRHLIKTGNKLAAINLTRQIYNCSLTEARNYVTNLTTQPDPLPPQSPARK